MKGKLVAGIGIYEPSSRFRATDSTGRHTKEYACWSRMLDRCNPNGSFQKTHPSYVGCKVDERFIHFQDFAIWCQSAIGFCFDGYELDKDILGNGKLYSPDTCSFIPQAINKLLTNGDGRGAYPVGVDYNRPKNKYRAAIRSNGKKEHIGYFDTVVAASAAYRRRKLDEIRTLVDRYTLHSSVKSKLLEYK